MITATFSSGLLAAVLLDEDPQDEGYTPPRRIRRSEYAGTLATASEQEIGETLVAA